MKNLATTQTSRIFALILIVLLSPAYAAGCGSDVTTSPKPHDCNGSADDGVLNTYYADRDNDGFGDPLEPAVACSAPTGFVADNGDCDDANPAVNPSGFEVPNGYDDNCNGQLNEGVYFGSCKSILASLPGSPSGPYTIDADGPISTGSPFEVHCDMTSNGGGWTLLAQTTATQNAPFQTWVDIMSRNFFLTAGNFTTSQGVPAGYLASMDFFAILHAAADLPFSEIRLDDGKGISLQNTTSTTTLRSIYNAMGVEPLYRNGKNTGVLLLLGKASHTGTFPCYYPNINGLDCQEYYTGDHGSESTAFYVGDLDMCTGGPASENLASALWGSADCYAMDQLGGHGGFTYHRPLDIANGGGGAYVNGGFALAGWTIQVR